MTRSKPARDGAKRLESESRRFVESWQHIRGSLYGVSRACSNRCGSRATRISTACPGSWSSISCAGLTATITCSIHSTRSGRAKLPSPPGRSPNIFAPPIVTPAPTSRSISAIRSSRASRQSRRSRIQMRGIRPPERRPSPSRSTRCDILKLHLISLVERQSSRARPARAGRPRPKMKRARSLSAPPRKSI